jgi:hypothetical protein
MSSSTASSLNIGLIILAGCIFTGFTMLYLKGPKEPDVTVEGIGGMPQSNIIFPSSLNTNSNDVTYHTLYTPKEGLDLLVFMNSGPAERITGQKIEATYYHVSHLLMVQYELEGAKHFRYYQSPMKWYSE